MREDRTSNDEAGARDHATHAGRTEDFGGGVGEHVLTSRPASNRFDYIVVCSCQWTSDPVRIKWVEATKRRHLAEVAHG